MSQGYGFNWSWMTTPTTTKRASDVVHQGGGTIFSFRQASGGVISSSDLNAFSKSVGQNLQSIRSDWRTYIRPVLNSLPAGDKDKRWSTSVGKGLPSKIDCFVYGIQGSTLFVFNDADATKADGRYWYSTGYRPKTIAEAFEDLYEAVNEISTATTASTTVDLDPLWAAIGFAYKGTNRATTVGSLDARVGLLETYVTQLNNDIYEPTTYSYQIGTPLVYSIARNIEELLKIHNVSSWQSNPANVSHSAVTVAAHTHPFTQVISPPAAALTQARVGPYTSLYNEILRIRYEIQATRGSTSWYTDVTSPFAVPITATLGLHVNYIGAGVATANNPHAVHYTNTGADLVFNAIRSFTGMTNNTDATPTYTSTVYVTQGVALEVAIGELDAAIDSLPSNIVRLDYSYDRSAMSETDRENTVITITHNIGRKPIVEVLDTSPTVEDYYGQYTSPAVDVNIIHVSANQLQIWTGAAKIEVILIG